MLPNEAKKIIETLANGMDPKTGRLFPEQSVFNNPLVIRALFADKLGRTETGIAARLVRLGRVKDRASAYDRKNART